ncbi:hypothetical protein JCM8202_000618 [Rhodotorula sphaerocarpa]
MGIGGLLPLLKEIQRPCHVKEWKGKRVAVDGYVWLHRGAYGCAEDLALGRPTIKYVNYAMHRVRMLKYFGVTPVMVFDGGLLPSKMGTEDDRERRRAEALAKGKAFRAEGRASQARECFVKAVDVTPAMAYQLIKALKTEGVEFVVAPYEADPQLAYLEKTGFVDAVVTEDSDLLVFGCRNVLFKLDGEGNCVSISRDDFSKCREYNLAGWSDAEFRHMAILSGCDYLDSVVGLGLKTAHRLLRKYRTPDKVIQFVRLEGNLNVPRTYLDDFRRAELTFLHQHVYDPRTRSLTHLTPLPDGKTAEDLPFIGPLLKQDYARGIAEGEIDPITKERMVDLMPGPSAPRGGGTASRAPAATSGSTSRGQRAAASMASDSAKPASKGTILSFFSRRAAGPAPVNPVKVAKSISKDPMAEAAKENVRPKPPAEEAPRASKFFGSAARRSGPAAEQPHDPKAEPQVGGRSLQAVADELLELEEDEDGDAEAEAALRDIELDIELRSHVALSADAASTSASSSESRDAGEGGAPRTEARHQPAAVVAELSSRRSSPPLLATPSPSPGRATSKGTARAAREEHGSPGGVSSPANSMTCHAGWPAVAAQDRVDILSSPVPKFGAQALLGQPLPKVESPSTAAATISLSSDPIVLSSEMDHRGEEATPRPPKRSPRPAKLPKAAPTSRTGKVKSGPTREKAETVAVWEDTPRVKRAADDPCPTPLTGSGNRKARSRPAEPPVEAIEAVQAVAASWRAKFMLPSKNRGGGRPSNPAAPVAPPARAAAPPVRSKPLGEVTNVRLPSAPRSLNPAAKRSASMVLPDSGASGDLAHVDAVKKRRTVSTVDLLASERSSDDLETPDTSSSSPTAVTNPRLLAFRFTGAVRRE